MRHRSSIFHRMTRNLFGDFLLRRLLTDLRRGDLFGRCRYSLGLRNIPQISQIYTDFSSSGLFTGVFFTQISQMTQIFSSGTFIHRMTRNLFGDFLLGRLLTDFHGSDLFGRCRYPLRLDKAIRQRFKKICEICEICGTKKLPRRKICVTKTIREYFGRQLLARGQISAKIRE